MSHFLEAIAFITVLPFGQHRRFSPAKMAAYFPAVGLLIGVLLAVFHVFCRWIWPPVLVCLLDTLFLVAVTGAFHLDGLGDSADGLLSHRDRQRALEIMKDSRLGTMGMVAIVSVLLIKWAALCAMDRPGIGYLIVVPALARGSILLGMRWLPYARPTQGTGRPFFEHPLSAKDFRWVLAVALAALLLGWTGLRLLIAFGLVNALLLFGYQRRMAGITGDMLGAMVEINEAALLLAVAAGNG